MAFPDTITVADATPVDVDYDLISLKDRKSERSDATRELGAPRSLIISHETTGKGLTAVDRHLVRFNRVEEDTESDSIATISASVYLVIEAPRRIVTKTMIEDMIVQLQNFLDTAGYQDKLFNSEP
jgi:hypothetical protein